MADDPSLPPRFKLVVIGETGVGKSTVTFRFTDDVYFEEHVPTLGVDFKYAGITVPDPATGTERSMMLQIWDTAGQESFQAMTSQYYRGCHGGVLCFDLTRRESFASLHAWLRRYRRNVAATSAKLGPGGPAGHARRPSAEPGHTPPSGRQGGDSDDDGGGGDAAMPDDVPPLLLVGCKKDLADGIDAAPNAAPAADGVAAASVGRGLREVATEEAAEWAARHGLRYIETSAKAGWNVALAFETIASLMLERYDAAASRALPPGAAGGGKRGAVHVGGAKPAKGGATAAGGGGRRCGC